MLMEQTSAEAAFRMVCSTSPHAIHRCDNIDTLHCDRYHTSCYQRAAVPLNFMSQSKGI